MPGFSTRAIRAASRAPDAPQAPLNVPIYQTSTFEVADAVELAELLDFQRPGHSYARYSNPTHAALEAALAELEGAEAALVTASGMAAVHGVVLSLLRSGDELIVPRAVYGGMVGPHRRDSRPFRHRAHHRRHDRPGAGGGGDHRSDPPSLARDDQQPDHGRRRHRDARGTRARARRPAGRGQHLRLSGPGQPAGPGRGRRRPLDHQVHRRALGPHGRRAGRELPSGSRPPAMS